MNPKQIYVRTSCTSGSLHKLLVLLKKYPVGMSKFEVEESILKFWEWDRAFSWSRRWQITIGCGSRLELEEQIKIQKIFSLNSVNSGVLSKPYHQIGDKFLRYRNKSSKFSRRT